MAIRRYGFWNDDLAWIDEWLHPFKTSWTVRGQWVDPERYDIVPRPEYRKTLIENKQKELDRLDEERKVLEEELRKLKTG